MGFDFSLCKEYCSDSASDMVLYAFCREDGRTNSVIGSTNKLMIELKKEWENLRRWYYFF
jgi:hypothetical protein